MTETAALDTLIGYHLRRATNVIMADLADRMATLGLRPTEASVLVLLNGEALLSQSELGRKLAIKRANMAPLIAGLVVRGLIARVEAPGRAQPLRATRKGQTLARKAMQAMADHENEHFSGLAPADRAKLLDILTRLWSVAPADSPPAQD